MAFTILPVETLQQIFGYFCVHCREKHQSMPPHAYLRGRQHPNRPSWYSLERHTLFSLCLVSKHVSHIAQAILYHEFMPGYGDSWRSDLYTWDSRLTSFMRTVARRRDLAALVKRIYVHPYLLESLYEAEVVEANGVSYPIPPPLPECISEEEARDTLRPVALALGIEEPQQLSADDLVTLLIAELPNLQHCSLQLSPYPDEIVRPAGLRAAGISHLPLKTVDISLHAWANKVDLFSLEQRARALFEVSPCLETLNLHMCSGIWHRVPFPSLPDLKTLRLTFSRLSEEALKGLLYSCDGLRSFTYEATRRLDHLLDGCGYTNLSSGSDHFQLANAVKYLSRHRETLESLHLDLRRRGHSDAGLDTRAVFTFREFTLLEHLFLNLDEFHSRFWAGSSPAEDSQILVQLLPPRIVSLHLAGHIKNELPRLEKALLSLADATSHGQFPRLKQVRWDKNEKLNCEDVVSTMFAATGVSFGYDSWPTTKSTLGDGDVSPPPNYSDPFPFEDMDDPDL